MVSLFHRCVGIERGNRITHSQSALLGRFADCRRHGGGDLHQPHGFALARYGARDRDLAGVGSCSGLAAPRGGTSSFCEMNEHRLIRRLAAISCLLGSSDLCQWPYNRVPVDVTYWAQPQRGRAFQRLGPAETRSAAIAKRSFRCCGGSRGDAYSAWEIGSQLKINCQDLRGCRATKVRPPSGFIFATPTWKAYPLSFSYLTMIGASLGIP